MSTFRKDLIFFLSILLLTTYIYVQYNFTFLKNNVKTTAFSLHALYNDNHLQNLMLIFENDVKNVNWLFNEDI